MSHLYYCPGCSGTGHTERSVRHMARCTEATRAENGYRVVPLTVKEPQNDLNEKGNIAHETTRTATITR